MPIAAQRRRAGGWVAGLTAIVAVAAFLLVFRPVRPGPPPVRPAPTPPVVVARLDQQAGDGLMREQATLFDPTPLFLPTEWNTNQRALPATVQHQPGQVFRPFESKPLFGEAELSLPIGPVSAVGERPADLLKEPSHDPFLGFDREDRDLPPLAFRPGYVEVRSAGTGEIVLARSLDDSLVLPPAQRAWQPAEFFIAVTPAGLLGGPTDPAGAEVEEMEVFFRDYLAKNLHLGERLAPGIYRIVVGP